MTTSPIRRVDNIGIAVRDLERSLRFYVEVLGLGLSRPYAPGQRGNAVLAGDTVLYLFETDHPDAFGRRETRNLDLYHNPVGFDHLSFEVDDLDAAGRTLEQRGVRFLGPLTDAGGLRYRGFSDPDDNILYLLEHRTTQPRT